MSDTDTITYRTRPSLIGEAVRVVTNLGSLQLQSDGFHIINVEELQETQNLRRHGTAYVTDLRHAGLELDDRDRSAVARLAHGPRHVRLVDLQAPADDLEHVETDQLADGEECRRLGRVGDGNQPILDPFVQSLAGQVLRAVAGRHGAGNVDERLAFLPDLHGVDDGEGLRVDDVDRVAVLVHRVHA